MSALFYKPMLMSALFRGDRESLWHVVYQAMMSRDQSLMDDVLDSMDDFPQLFPRDVQYRLQPYLLQRAREMELKGTYPSQERRAFPRPDAPEGRPYSPRMRADMAYYKGKVFDPVRQTYVEEGQATGLPPSIEMPNEPRPEPN